MPPSYSHLRCLLLMMVALPLAPAPSSPPQPPLMPPHCLDKEMACFINSKCEKPAEDEDIVRIKTDGLLCDVHVEIRPYSTTKALIRLKTKDQKSVKISIWKEPTPFLGCEMSGNEIVVVSATTQKLINYESLPSGGIACEFLYEKDPLFDTQKKSTVQLGATPIHTLTNVFWGTAQDFIKCNMDWLDSKFESDEKFVFNEPDKRFNKVVCRPGDGELVYGDDSGNAVEVTIECSEDISMPDSDPTRWKYDIKKADKAGTRLSNVNGAPAGKVGCRQIGCQKCKIIPPCLTKNCVAPKIELKDDCSTLKCDGNRISIDTLPNATLGTPTCAANEEDGQYRWLLDGKKFDKIACATTVHCQDLTPLKSADLDLYKQSLKCKDPLQIKIVTGDVEKQTAKIECDMATGNWTTAESEPVARDSTLSCIAGGANEDLLPAGASLGTAETIAIAVVGVVIVAVILLLIFCFVYKPKKRAGAKKKLKTVTDSRQEDDTRTALPVGYRPPLSNTTSDQPTPIKVEINAAELVEKTGISRTPDPPKPPSVLMDTAVLPATTPSEDQKDTKEVRASAHTEDQKEGKQSSKHRSQSDGSEPRSIKIGQDGEAIIPEKKKKKTKKTDDKSQSHSEAGATTRKEEKPAKPVDSGPKPRVFALDAKEEKIRRGATVKNTDYPTLAEIDSDWDDYDHAKALAAGSAEAGKKKRGKTTDGKTVPTAVTPDVPPSVERTQATNTRHTQDAADPADMENLVTQLDTTVEQKEADGKKK